MKFHYWQENKIDFQNILDRKTMIFWVDWFKHDREETKISKAKKNQSSCFSSDCSEFKLHAIHASDHECCSYFSDCEVEFDSHYFDSQLHN